MRRGRTLIIILLLVGFVILGVAGVMIYGITKTHRFRVPTGAMMNTIVPGDHVMATTISDELNRGDVVVFQYPGDDRYTFVARIVGLPNETIDLRGTAVYINDRPLEEQRVMIAGGDIETDSLPELSVEGTGPYRVYYDVAIDRTNAEATTGDVSFPHRIPGDSFFLLGDNRDNSHDSRYRGDVPRSLIIARAVRIYYSEKMDTGEVRWDRFFKRIQ